MNRNCITCNIEIGKNNYLKNTTVWKNCYIKIEERTKINNQKSIKSTTTMTTALMFQHMKITFMFLSVQETLAKLLSCSKHLKE